MPFYKNVEIRGGILYLFLFLSSSCYISLGLFLCGNFSDKKNNNPVNIQTQTGDLHHNPLLTTSHSVPMENRVFLKGDYGGLGLVVSH